MKSFAAKAPPSNMPTTKRKRGRPPVDDPRKPVPFRIKESLIRKLRRLGREKLENWIKRAKP